MTCLSSVGILVCFCSVVVELPHANSWPTVQEQAKSRPLILVSGFIHDVSSFRKEHPGGNWLLESNVGKDATAAFFGGYYAHSSAAHNVSLHICLVGFLLIVVQLLSMMRVGILDGGVEVVAHPPPPQKKLYIATQED